MKCDMFHLYSTLRQVHQKKDALMLGRLKIYQESGPIKDARVVVVLRTGNTGVPNVAPHLFIGKDVELCSHTFKLATTAFIHFVTWQ